MPDPSSNLDRVLASITPDSVRALTLRMLAHSTQTRSVAVTTLIAELRAGSDLGTGAIAAAAYDTLREAIKQAVIQTPELRYVAASA